jgi:hypothetical protein
LAQGKHHLQVNFTHRKKKFTNSDLSP